MNMKKYRVCLIMLMIVVLICAGLSVYYFMENNNTNQEGMLVQKEYTAEGETA